MMKKDRMRLTGIRSPKHNHVRFFGLTVGTGAAARPKHSRQTGDAGGMSSSIAAINIVRAHDGADKFLGNIIQLVSGLGAAEHAKVTRIASGKGSSECRSDSLQRFFPGSRTVDAIFADQWLGQAACV